MDVTARRGNPADAPSVTALYLRARRAAALVGSIPALVHSDDDVSAWMTSVVMTTCELWLAEGPKQALVGMLVLSEEWIEQLYVDPDLLGQGTGLLLLEIAKRERPAGLQLWTFASNAGAQRFYERHGFNEVERTDGSDNEERAPDIHYAWGGRHVPQGP